jgi:hypothetical protein
MERIAQLIEAMTGIGIDVYGFDTGKGLPKPTDFRDQPNMWFEGQLPMKQELLLTKLKKASLIIGDVRETVPRFMANDGHAPIGFVSFDLDLYSSTRDALAVFSGDLDRLLPRVICYFDDIMGHSYSDYTGERLAINEFNQAHRMRKLCPVYGLRYYLPKLIRDEKCWECMFWHHAFEHPKYNALDSERKAVYMDDQGGVVALEVSEGWRDRVLL